MAATCLKCNHVAEGDPGPACPNCGAYYAKVEAHRRQVEERTAREQAEREQREREAAEREAKRQQHEAALARSNAIYGNVVCSRCGHIGPPRRYTKGSLALEITLYLLGLFFMVSIIGFFLGALLFVGGIIYTIWRVTSRFDGCEKCKAPEIVPGDSPRGREALKSAGII